MNKKEFEKVSGRMYKNLMKNPNWKSYELGLKEGKKQGALGVLKQVVDAINPREYAEELIKELEGEKQ